MPRYFFHFQDSAFLMDSEGNVLLDETAARRTAEQLSFELAGEAAWLIDRWSKKAKSAREFEPGVHWYDWCPARARQYVHVRAPVGLTQKYFRASITNHLVSRWQTARRPTCCSAR
jgi:hypothetical protein